MIDWTTVLASLICSAFSAGAIYGAVRKDIFFLRRDVDHSHKRHDDHERDYIHQRQR